MNIGKYNIDIDSQCHIMGILNVTPDSFSDGGKYNNLDAAKFQAEKMINEGATIIDVGGESTRPGYTMISDEEEIERVCPVIRMIKQEFDICVSLDTYKSKVLEAAYPEGVDIINDIWGFKRDRELATFAAKNNLTCVLMHNREEAVYSDFVSDVVKDLRESVDIALNAGVSPERMIVDPGVGFAKDYEQNLEIIRSLDRLQMLGFPVLLAASNKSVVGNTLNLPADQRLEGTIAVNVTGVLKGARIFRVHDVKPNLLAIRMAEALL
jgi:dihydropteroate synthase